MLIITARFLSIKCCYKSTRNLAGGRFTHTAAEAAEAGSSAASVRHERRGALADGVHSSYAAVVTQACVGWRESAAFAAAAPTEAAEAPGRRPPSAAAAAAEVTPLSAAATVGAAEQIGIVGYTHVQQ